MWPKDNFLILKIFGVWKSMISKNFRQIESYRYEHFKNIKNEDKNMSHNFETGSWLSTALIWLPDYYNKLTMYKVFTWTIIYCLIRPDTSKTILLLHFLNYFQQNYCSLKVTSAAKQ